MRHWNSRKALLHLTAILVMILSLALIGCGDDGQDGGEELTPQDLAGKTFILPASFFDPLLPGTATITYGPAIAINGDEIPFTATFSDAPDVTITGTATVNSIEFEITRILAGDPPVEIQEITIGTEPNTVTFAVGDTINIDTQQETLTNGTFVIVWINEDGDEIVFRFPEGVDTDTGSGGTGGGD